MIETERFTVHAVGEHDTAVRIHDPIEFDRGAVVTIWLGAKEKMVLVVVHESNREAIVLSNVDSFKLTNLSAPSIHTYRAFLVGLAFLITSAITTPVNNAVLTPAAPHENPLLFFTTFCSFRRFPAHTRVTGYVTFSQADDIKSRRVSVNGFSTHLYRGCVSLGKTNRVPYWILPFNAEFPI